MNFTLKGISNSSQIECASQASVEQYVFDLRPKSFNFVQLHKIKSISKDKFLTTVGLLFDNEKDFVIKELCRNLRESSIAPELQFINVSDLNFIHSLGEDCSIYFNSDLRLSKIKDYPGIKKIILEHKILEEYQQRGELFGFLNLLKEETGDLLFELKLDWNSVLIESMLDYFHFDTVSFEIDSSVEISYQQIDEQLVLKLLRYFKKQF